MARRGVPVEEPPLVFIDSTVWIDLIDREKTSHPETGLPRWRSAEELFIALDDHRVRLAASSLIEAEIACNGKVRQSAQAVARVRAWFDAPSTTWTDIDRFLVRDAVELTESCAEDRYDKTKKFAGNDPLHLAAAIRLGCDFLITQDQGFPIGRKVGGVQVIFPTQVWAPSLFDGHKL